MASGSSADRGRRLAREAFSRALRLEDGQALVEYALILVFVAVVAAVILADLGPIVRDSMEPVVDAF